MNDQKCSGRNEGRRLAELKRSHAAGKHVRGHRGQRDRSGSRRVAIRRDVDAG